MKQLWAILILTAVISGIGVPADAARPVKRVGVLMWSDDHGYYQALKGVRDQLREEGFGEPALQLTVRNARGGRAKLSEMARSYAAAKMDLVVSIGTTASIAAAREIANAPLVFVYVYDPLQSGIVRTTASASNNSTGVSSRASMAKLVNFLKEFAPVTRLAVLYTPGEKNSELQLQELQKILAGSRIRVIPVIFSRGEQAD